MQLAVCSRIVFGHQAQIKLRPTQAGQRDSRTQGHSGISLAVEIAHGAPVRAVAAGNAALQGEAFKWQCVSSKPHHRNVDSPEHDAQQDHDEDNRDQHLGYLGERFR